MPLLPKDWNVAVIGGWNPALLTPQYIAKDLLGIPEGSDIKIEVPIDVVGPFRVSHDGLVVMVTSTRLIIEATANDFASLESAKEVALRAMLALPKTPLTVAGYNLRYSIPELDPSLGPLVEATQLVGDNRFKEAGYPLARRDVVWVVDWEGGKMSVGLTREGQVATGLTFNFERVGDREHLEAWLKRPANQSKSQMDRIVTEVLGLSPEVLG